MWVVDITEQSLTVCESVIIVGHSCVALGVRIGDMTEAKYESGTQKTHSLLSYGRVAWTLQWGQGVVNLQTSCFWTVSVPWWQGMMSHLQTSSRRAVPPRP
jgi:hypothetical protein